MRAGLIALLLALLPLAAGAEELMVADFESGGLSGWSEKVFAGKTDYTIVPDGNGHCLQAVSVHAASGLIHNETFDPHRYPRVAWRWKVNRILTRGDSTTRAGDDYPARLYITFPNWLFFNITSLNYIWANKLPAGSFQPSVYTGNSVMVAVESGAGKVGAWAAEERNILDDYRRAFGTEAPHKAVVALMTDTDNTGESATACYDDIRLLR